MLRALPCWLWLSLLLAMGGVPCANAGPAEHTGAVSGRITHAGRGVRAVVSIRERLPAIAHPYNYWRQAASIQRRLADVPADGRPWRRVRTDARGWFRVDGLAPAAYELKAEAPGGPWGGALAPIVARGEHVEVDIPLLDAGHQLTGRVRHVDGRPFRGLVLAYQGGVPRFYNDAPSVGHERWARCDAEGRFRVEGLADAPTHLVAHEVGRLRHRLPRTVRPGHEVDFVLDDHPEPFHGHVLDIETRKPVPGATLTWSGWWDGHTQPCGVVTADAQGHFVIPRPRDTPHVEEIHVRAQGYGRRRFEYVRRDGQFVALLRKAARVEGRVLDPQGHPVAGIAVRIEHVSWDKRQAGRSPFAERMQVGLNEPVTTDAEGRFVHPDLDWGDVQLYARGDGWVPAGLVAVDRFTVLRGEAEQGPVVHTLRPGETLAVTLRVERGAVLRGRLRAPSGTPVAGVPILFDSDGNDPLFGWTGYERPPLAATDAEGRFEIPGLLHGSSFELEARRGGYPKVAVVTPPLDRAGTPPLELTGLGPTAYERAGPHPDPDRPDAPAKGAPAAPPTMEPGKAPAGPATPPDAKDAPRGRWILLQVLAADTGKPIAGAHVHAMMNTRAGASERFEIEWTTDEEGRVRMGPFGELTGDLSVGRVPGYIGRNQVGFGMPTPEGKRMVVKLQKAFEIHGRVLRPDGTPAAGSEVRIRNLDPGFAAHYRNRVRIGADGRFVSRHHVHAEIRYELKATLWDDVRGYEATVVVLGKDGPKDITLAPIHGSEAVVKERRERLRVRVLDPRGEPVPRVSIRLGHQTPATFEGGLATFSDTVTAKDTLRIWGAAAEDGWPLPCGSLVLEPVGRATGELVVRLPAPKTLRGVVTRPDGSPAAGVPVRALSASSTDPLRPERGVVHARDRTDAEGRFHLGNLGDETYELRFDVPDGLLAPTPHLRTKPSDEPVTVRLRVPVTIRVRLLDAEGKPMAGAGVRVGIPTLSFNRWVGDMDTLRATREAKTDAEGFARLEGMDPLARYTLQIHVRKGEGLEWMHRSDWKPTDGDITFRPDDD